MSNPPGPDHDATPADYDAEREHPEPDTEVLEAAGEQGPDEPKSAYEDAPSPSDAPTEVIAVQDLTAPPAPDFASDPTERFHAPPAPDVDAPSDDVQPPVTPGVEAAPAVQLRPGEAPGAVPAPDPPQAQNEPQPPQAQNEPQPPQAQNGPEPPTQRRYTAPGFDAKPTEQFDAVQESPTEVISMPKKLQAVAPPPYTVPEEPPKEPTTKRRRGWRWALVVILVLAALAAVAIVGTVWFTRTAAPRISPEDRVRVTIQNFDVAVQKGDLATLRSITCGDLRDRYVRYDDKAWSDTHARVAAAKQYPVVASIDQVVVNGDYAEANVTTFMAYAPQTRSTRSFDLQYRDGQWKVCQGAVPPAP